jgi:hypothetical protein
MPGRKLPLSQLTLLWICIIEVACNCVMFEIWLEFLISLVSFRLWVQCLVKLFSSMLLSLWVPARFFSFCWQSFGNWSSLCLHFSQLASAAFNCNHCYSMLVSSTFSSLMLLEFTSAFSSSFSPGMVKWAAILSLVGTTGACWKLRLSVSWRWGCSGARASLCFFCDSRFSWQSGILLELHVIS